MYNSEQILQGNQDSTLFCSFECIYLHICSPTYHCCLKCMYPADYCFFWPHIDLFLDLCRKSLVWKVQQTYKGIWMSVTSATQQSINSFMHSLVVISKNMIMRHAPCPTDIFPPWISLLFPLPVLARNRTMERSCTPPFFKSSLLAQCLHTPFPFQLLFPSFLFP